MSDMKTNSDISFKSKINIVTSQKVFDSLQKGKYIHYYTDRTHNDIVKAADFYTVNIKTCTGGGLVSRKEKTAVGFHLWDKIENLGKAIETIKTNIISPSNGLLIGAKKRHIAEDSVPNFEKLKNSLSEICDNMSFFKTFKNQFSKADFAYCKEQDCWNIRLSTYDEKTQKRLPVRSLKSLLEFFDEIFIAPSDTLFINGKQITPKDAPQIFIRK